MQWRRGGARRRRGRAIRASMDPGDGLSENFGTPAEPGRAAHPSPSDQPPTPADATARPVIATHRPVTPAGGALGLEDITLTVRGQEIFGLLGPNGAGKTSLLKALLLPELPHSGTIRLFGEPHGTSGARSRLAYLPQRFQPPGHLSGRDFVGLT